MNTHINSQISSLLLTLVLTLGSGDCFAQSDSEKRVLHIAGWDVYADPIHKNKTIGFKGFEDETGYTIKFTALNNLDDIINYAETNNSVDLLIISNEGIEILYKMNLLSDLDINKIPYYQDLHHDLRYSSWGQFDGNLYAVPWAWGPTGLLYDSSKVSEPKSWNVLWEPQYKSSVSLWDDISMIWITALSLGYKNVYNLTVTQLSEVKEKLLHLNNQVYGYYSGEKEEIDYLLSGKVLITNSWFDPSARLAKLHNKSFRMVIPKEGAVGMFDSFLITKNCKLQDISLHFINYQISPEVQYKMSDITGLAPSNIETLSLMSQNDIKRLHLDEPSYFKKMILWNVMPRKHLYEAVLQEVRQELIIKNQLD